MGSFILSYSRLYINNETILNARTWSSTTRSQASKVRMCCEIRPGSVFHEV
jgi:hypothetical protein